MYIYIINKTRKESKQHQSNETQDEEHCTNKNTVNTQASISLYKRSNYLERKKTKSDYNCLHRLLFIACSYNPVNIEIVLNVVQQNIQ
jgi:hypothetical protein